MDAYGTEVERVMKRLFDSLAEKVIENHTAGDPMRGDIKWTNLSRRTSPLMNGPAPNIPKSPLKPTRNRWRRDNGASVSPQA